VSAPGTAARPSLEQAVDIVAGALGEAPVGVRRFQTGLHHYVYEATFAARPPVVVRIAKPSERRAMAGALHLSGLLRPLGVPLPEVLAADVDAECPWLLLVRLPGTDLGAVTGSLSDEQLASIAAGVAEAQAAAARVKSADRYGYAVRPEEAPLESWPQVLEASLARSRARILAAGLFDPKHVELLERAFEAHRTGLATVAATPFLHDTTTENVIVSPEGALSGIVDVDDLCFGDPRYPAALTLASLRAGGGPQQYVGYWQEAAGWPADATFDLYVAIFLLDFMGEHGHDFNGNMRSSEAGERQRLEALYLAATTPL
jgi:aminoglycoside phosphotransferase (APT) family kinase protein